MLGTRWAYSTIAAVVVLTSACSRKPTPSASETGTLGAPRSVVRSDDIPVAHTPPGGYHGFPKPILARCTEPLVAGAPDLRGMWRVEAVTVRGMPAPSWHPLYGHVGRIEQCGNRIVITGGGVIHDMRADGTAEHGLDDVIGLNNMGAFDFKSPVRAIASYENGAYVLHAVPDTGLIVTRRLEGKELVWTYGTRFTARLQRIGDTNAAPPPPSSPIDRR